VILESLALRQRAGVDHLVTKQHNNYLQCYDGDYVVIEGLLVLKFKDGLISSVKLLYARFSDLDF
jgi:hypothetical protein